MGQRHQVIVFVRDKDKNLHTFAYHNQWCYGSLPLHHLERFVIFQDRADKHSRIGDMTLFNDSSYETMIRAILSVGYTQGFYSNYFSVLSEMKTKKGINPHRGDNNDGITVMYMESGSKVVKYCYMGVFEDWEGGYKVPLSVREYLRLYYSEGDKDWDKALVKRLEKKAVLLTASECIELLPAFYTLAEKKILTAPINELPLHINDTGFIGYVVRQRLRPAA